MRPIVSVCVPTFNRASTLVKTINAILKQTFPDWELIICDDASTDETEQVVTTFEDKRIRYFRSETNRGLYENWNYGISLATGKYVAIYHDHDLYLPTILEKSVALLEQYPSVSFVHTALLMIDANYNPVGVDVRSFPEYMSGTEMKRLLVTGWASPVMAATAMVRKTAYDSVGSYNYQQYGLGCDLDMWLRLSQIGNVAYVQEPQAFIRVRTRSDSTAQFNWPEVRKGLHMHRNHLMQEFTKGRLSYYFAKAKYFTQRDKRLLTYGIRAVLLEPSDVIDEGDKVIRSEASLWVYTIVKVVKNSKALQVVLRKNVLSYHYKRISRWYEIQKTHAVKFLENNQALKNFLDTVSR